MHTQTEKNQLVLQVLQESYQVMQDPSKICLGWPASDRPGLGGRHLYPDSPEATCFCSIGIIQHCIAGLQLESNLTITLECMAIDLLIDSMRAEVKPIWVHNFGRVATLGPFHDLTALDDRETFLRVWARAVANAQEQARTG